MNVYNEKRLIKVLDELNHLEEEILPCWAEEDAFLKCECDNERFTKEMIKSKDRLDMLEAALTYIKSCRDYLSFVVESNKIGSS